MDIGRFIERLITIGFILATMGTLSEVNNALKKETKAAIRGTISLGKFNRQLGRGQ